MKKILFISVALILMNFNFSAYSRTVTTITPLRPPLSNGADYQSYLNDSYPKITQVEKAIFNKTFVNEDIYNRLDRIENKMFNQTNPNMDLAQRVDLITQNINPSVMCNIPLDNLSRIEIKLFNRSYVNDDPETRVIRLEKEMLGAMQQGELEERYEVVANAAKHYNAFPVDIYNNGNKALQSKGYQQYPQQPYIASSNVGGGTGIIHNVLSALTGGALTGFTPSLTDPYGSYCSSPYMTNNPYQNNFGQSQFPGSGAGFSNAMKTNTGYSLYNKNYGTGSGVHVIYD